MEETVLSCGKLTAIFANGGLREVRYGGVELIREIYAAVRNRDWETVPSEITSVSQISCPSNRKLQFQALHQDSEIDFAWEGTIELGKDYIRFTFDGVANKPFWKNRIGFCVLHPMHFAGMPIEVKTPSGIIKGNFPKRISPHQPFKQIKNMNYTVDSGVNVSVQFEGDIFEMEDQRNWTDASYKTYCTPLELPFPIQLKAGEAVKQSITVNIKDERPITQEPAQKEREIIVNVTPQQKYPLPEIGTVYTSLAERLPHVRNLLGELNLSYYHLVLHLADPSWLTLLQEATETALATQKKLQIELVADSAGAQLQHFIDTIESTQSPVERILVFSESEYVTSQRMVRMIRKKINAADISIGGGTRAYFAEFNRASLPIEVMDVACYTINPQVHAFDDRSLMETLQAQSATVTNALRITSGKPLCIGPITLKPRFNPNATSGGSIPLKDQIDSRLHQPIGAAWMLGSLSALAMDGVRSLTYFELHGPLGFIADNGQKSPVFDALRHVLEFQDAFVCSATSSSPGDVSVLAFSRDKETAAFVTNLTPGTQQVKVRCLDQEHALILKPYEYTFLHV